MSAVAVAEDVFKIWAPAENLSPRVKKLREEYFDYDNRDYFRNESIPYSTGVEWDSVYTPHERTIVPEFIPVLDSVQDTLLAFSRKIHLPEGFWSEPIIVRHALFFKEALEVVVKVSGCFLIVQDEDMRTFDPVHHRFGNHGPGGSKGSINDYMPWPAGVQGFNDLPDT